jgi:hypothetical protein
MSNDAAELAAYEAELRKKYAEKYAKEKAVKDHLSHDKIDAIHHEHELHVKQRAERAEQARVAKCRNTKGQHDHEAAKAKDNEEGEEEDGDDDEEDDEEDDVVNGMLEMLVKEAMEDVAFEFLKKNTHHHHMHCPHLHRPHFHRPHFHRPHLHHKKKGDDHAPHKEDPLDKVQRMKSEKSGKVLYCSLVMLCALLCRSALHRLH